MNRVALIGFIAAATAACETQPLQYQSTLNQQTNGIALRGADASGRSVAQAGMMGTTCEVDTRWATLGTDIDYPSNDEVVQDAGTVNGQDVVVITTEEKVFIQDGSDWTSSAQDYNIGGVADAVVAGTDVIVLVDTPSECSVRWVMGGHSRALESGACSTTYDLTADPSSGSAIVGSDGGALIVTPSSTEVLTEQSSSLSEWDGTAGVLYATEAGSSVLRAHELDGSVRWTTDVGASIIGIDDMGTRAMAAVSVAFPNGTGAVLLVDGWTGDIVDNVSVPNAVSSIKGSPDGRTLALVDRNQVHFYGTESQASSWDFDPWSVGGDVWGW